MNVLRDFISDVSPYYRSCLKSKSKTGCFDFSVDGIEGKVFHGNMKKLLLLLPALLVLKGCPRHYVITLNNGMKMDSVGKPRLQDNVYVFKSRTGEMRK